VELIKNQSTMAGTVANSSQTDKIVNSVLNGEEKSCDRNQFHTDARTGGANSVLGVETFAWLVILSFHQCYALVVPIHQHRDRQAHC
jgi:hypothetical protein